MIKRFTLITVALATAIGLWATAPVTLTLQADRPGAKIQPTMYGLFFEDINYAADGGLYAEMVKNRSFEFPDPLMGWQAFGGVEVKSDGPFDRCPHYISLTDPGHRHKRTGLTNEGFFGVAFREGEEYRFSVWARAPHGKSAITIELIDPATLAETQVRASAKLSIDSPQWKKYTVTLTPVSEWCRRR